MHTYNVVSYAKQKLLKNWTRAFVRSDQVSPVLAGCNSGGAAHSGGGCGEAGGGEGMMTLRPDFPLLSGTDQDSSFHKRRSGIEAKAMDLTFLQHPEQEGKKRWI